MPISIRYTDIRNGGIVMTGNTLGLSKSANANAPGQLGSIGAFTSLNLSLQVGNFPPGTTLDYTQNGSSAQLNLPAGSGILHAELIWGGLYRSTVNDISGILNQSVLFTAPDGAHTVAPIRRRRKILSSPQAGSRSAFTCAARTSLPSSPARSAVRTARSASPRSSRRWTRARPKPTMRDGRSPWFTRTWQSRCATLRCGAEERWFLRIQAERIFP